MEWADKFAQAADNKERVGFEEAVTLTIEVATKNDDDLDFGADMVLQHYRHPTEATIKSLVMTAKKR